MNHKINAGNAATKHYLEISENGIEYCNANYSYDVRTFTFDQVDAVLRDASSILSFQVAEETFTIPMKPDSVADRAAVTRLLSEVRRTVKRASA